MLKIDPKKRISPDEILQHPFCSLSDSAKEYTFGFDDDEEFTNVPVFERIIKNDSYFISKTLIHSALTRFAECEP